MNAPRSHRYQASRVIQWVCFNIIFAVGVWMALLGLEGVGRVLMFGMWFHTAMCLIFLLTARDELRAKALAKGAPVPGWVSGWTTAGFVGVLVYQGWWMTGVGFLLLEFLEWAIYRGGEAVGKMDGMDKDGRNGRAE